MASRARSTVIVAIAVVIAITAVVALTMHKTPTATKIAAPTNAVMSNTVAITNYKFAPDTITVKTGTTVTWTNNDEVHHSVTADTKSDAAPTSPLFAKGETYSFKFTKAGSYTYHCEPHPYMHGTVVVTD